MTPTNQCLLTDPHGEHTWWYTSEGGGHMLSVPDPEAGGFKEHFCPGLGHHRAHALATLAENRPATPEQVAQMERIGALIDNRIPEGADLTDAELGAILDGVLEQLNAAEPEKRLVIRMNGNAKMTRGKYAAQAVHAALMLLDVHPGTPVIVLGSKPAEIETMLIQVRDAGRTELEPGTLTAGAEWIIANPTDPTEET